MRNAVASKGAAAEHVDTVGAGVNGEGLSMKRGYSELYIDVLMEFGHFEHDSFLGKNRMIRRLNLSWGNLEKILLQLKRNGLIIEVDHNGPGLQRTAFELTDKGWRTIEEIRHLSEVIPFQLKSNEKDSRIARLP